MKESTTGEYRGYTPIMQYSKEDGCFLGEISGLSQHDISFEEGGHMIRGGSIVDAMLIQAPNATKNAEKQRDPEMCRTKKGNQYYSGIKCHIGVNADSGYVHSLEMTAANVHDITVAHQLLREDDDVVYCARTGWPLRPA
jgi:IS5 family transposase